MNHPHSSPQQSVEKSKAIENWSKQVANLTRQELMELEEKKKLPFKSFWTSSSLFFRWCAD